MENSEDFPASRATEAGLLLRDRYEIQNLLGEGGFARTYLAIDRRENQKCVVKALSLRHIDSFKAKELFEREAKTIENLNHPRIPKFLDFFTADSSDGIQIYLVQEYKAGKNLSQLVEQGRHFTEKEVIRIAIQIAEILEYLQGFSPPIIHRDIKPSNILLNASNEPSLIDFGAVRDKVLNDPLLRRDGPTIVGTYGYMPLEQFEGRAVPASDIYSLGVTLIFILSQKDPWEMEKEGMQLDFKPHVRISSELSEVLQRMIEPDPANRYASATELKEYLQALLKPKQKTSTAVHRKKYTGRKVLYGGLAAIAFAGFGVWYKYATRSIPVIINSTASSSSTSSSEIEKATENLPLFLSPRDVSSFIEVQEHDRFTTFLFTGDLSNTQILDLGAASDETLWIATSKGILRFDLPSRWRLFGVNADIPGERVDTIAAGPLWVAADLSHETRPGYSLSSGTYVLDPEKESWKKISGSAWDLYRDGSLLWVGTDRGVEAHDLKTEEVFRFTKENSGLRNNEVHAIQRAGDVVWFGSLGDYVQATKDFAGGGVSRLDLTTRKWSVFTRREGLARDYSCAIAADQKEVWVAHWDNEFGLSRYDSEAQKWDIVKLSKNGVPLGGVVLAMEPDYLWIGQQSGLIRLHRVSGHAVRFTELDGLPGYIISGIVLTQDAVWATVYAYGQSNIRSSGVIRISRNQ